MKSPVQSLSDSDQTEGTLSPALVPQFRRIPAPNSEKNQDFMEASDDDDELLEINVSNPLCIRNKKRRVVLSSATNSDTQSDEDQKVRAKTEVSQL